MGISIGHKDTDNVFRRNQIRGNGYSGVYFRDELAYAAGHRCVVEDCVIENNGRSGDYADQASAGIRIDGETEGVVLRNNVIRDTRPKGKRTQTYGILIGEDVSLPTLENNRCEGNVKGDALRLSR